MTPIIYFDICALILLVVIAFSIIFRKMTNGITNRMFIILVGLVFVDVVFDLWAVSNDLNASNVEISMASRYISHMGYLVIRNITIPAYAIYLVSLTDTWHKLKKGWFLKSLLFVPCAAIVALLVTNPATNLMYYFDENLKYTRGPLFVLVYVNALIYVLRHNLSYKIQRPFFGCQASFSLCNISAHPFSCGSPVV